MLQTKNLRWNLDAVQQQQGFLSIEYGEQDLAAINDGLGIFIAAEGDNLLAYAMAETKVRFHRADHRAHGEPFSRYGAPR